ncbi:unnamed protein product [Eruca vesicaria subsp. sativa]|uniref:Uncharacterized protein n=1 Tax=Eruca vesicaria subsp. sativa TaxID=29727 RepID=A0ABC8LXB7_ERUVS|nr:unnamed protein product [Eruca vesicaria subsp. sativa]
MAECCTVNAVRDGMNLVPYKYTLCRQGTPEMDKSLGLKCCTVNAVRDGMNLVPYKYTLCRQGTPEMDKSLGLSEDSPGTRTRLF